MNLDHSLLMSKYIGTKSALAVIMFVQGITAAETAFKHYTYLNERVKDDSQVSTMEMLAFARFFCEACGWCALAVRRLRHEETPEIHTLLINNQKHIDNLYGLRKAVNHHYYEDVADEYRTGNYKPGRHQDKLAFIFSTNADSVSFKIGTIEINMISQLASMKKIENDLLAINVHDSATSP